MFVLVNNSDDYGMNHCGNFNTHKEAYEYIAADVAQFYDGFDLMSMYPINDDADSMRCNDNGIVIYAGYDWCTCWRNDEYSDRWLIIEV